MAKFGQSWGDAASLCAGLALIGFGEVSSGALTATVGAAGLLGFVRDRQAKFGPECDRTRRRIQESVRDGFTRMLEIEGDDWSAHPDLAEADAALSAALKGCMIDRRRLAAAAVSRAGFPEGAVAAVMEGLAAERPDLFSPEREGTLAHQYAGAVVSAGVRAAAENADWYRALEPDLILAIGQALGETRDEVKAGREENRAGFAALMAKMEALEAKFGGAAKVDETAERLHVSRPELLALLEAILEEETPEAEIDAALVRGRERLSETKEEIARLRKQGNEAPEAQADLEAAAAALARPDIADLAAAQEALARARARWLEGRTRARAARAVEEAAARALEDATTFQFFSAEADLAKARLDHEGAARLLEAGAAEVEAGSRERLLLLAHAGDARAVSGGVVAGGPAHAQALEVARARLAAAPEDEVRLRDVSVSLERVGSVRVAAGDRARALAAYEEGLAIARDLAKRDPGNAGWARDVSVSLSKIGDVRVAEGDRAGALAAYEEGLAIARDLAARDPGNAVWARDVSVSLDRIGDVRVAAGDRAAALAAYEEGLTIARDLAARDPGNAEWSRDVWVSVWRMAGLDEANAAAHWAEVVAIMEREAAGGRLLPADEPFLEAARQNLSKARAR